MKQLLSLLFLCFVLEAPAKAETYQFDPAHSIVSFKVRHLLGKVSGRFRQLSGTIELDREHPEQASVQATIQVKSIDTGIPKRDEHLRSADFFDAQRFPEISFQSKEVRRTGKESAEISGQFTMHGVTRSIVLQVELLGFAKRDGRETTRWRITSEPLKRSNYALRWSPTVENTSMIGQEVMVTMEIEATRGNPL